MKNLNNSKIHHSHHSHHSDLRNHRHKHHQEYDSNQNLEFNNNSKNSSLIIAQLKNLKIGYRSNIVLSDINLKIHQGDYIGILGPNGCGKTTFLKTLLGLVEPLEGEIDILDPLFKNKSKKSSFFGYIPQFSPTKRDFPLSVHEVVVMGLYGQIGLFHHVTKQDYLKADEALHKVHMWHYRNRPIGHLSGGEQQKVMIARALVSNPKLLLMDEPTSSLDFRMTKSVFDLVRELNEEYGYTIIMIHHNINLIQQNCKRLLIFDHKIRYDGAPLTEKAQRIIKIAYHYIIENQKAKTS
ncbi:MAG: metal ABC transporter ATP-binding protein [Promethearchaeota archaeon]